MPRWRRPCARSSIATCAVRSPSRSVPRGATRDSSSCSSAPSSSSAVAVRRSQARRAGLSGTRLPPGPYGRALHVLARRGLKRKRAQTAREFEHSVGRALPAASEHLAATHAPLRGGALRRTHAGARGRAAGACLPRASFLRRRPAEGAVDCIALWAHPGLDSPDARTMARGRRLALSRRRSRGALLRGMPSATGSSSARPATTTSPPRRPPRSGRPSSRGP